MGSGSRLSRSDRYIKEFGADLVAANKVDEEKTWCVAKQDVVVDDRFEMPVMEFTLQCVGTDETLVLRDEQFLFDTQDYDPAEPAQDLAARLGIPEEQAIARLRQADLYWEPEVPASPAAARQEEARAGDYGRHAQHGHPSAWPDCKRARPRRCRARGGPQLTVAGIEAGHNIHHHSIWRFANGKQT